MVKHEIKNHITNGLQDGKNIIYSNSYAFAALKEDDKVVTWGHPYMGGYSSPYDPNTELGRYGVRGDLTNVVKIYSTLSAFSALKKDRSVVTWGKPEYGGDSSPYDPITNKHTNGVRGGDLRNVKKIY